jgi:hypothetical protein
MSNPTPSLDMVHIFSPEPEALLTPPWFLDDLYEDLPPNPPNSPIHFPTKILCPTTIFNPQYLDIWFMSRKPSQPPCITLPTSSPERQPCGDNHQCCSPRSTIFSTVPLRRRHPRGINHPRLPMGSAPSLSALSLTKRLCAS